MFIFHFILFLLKSNNELPVLSDLSLIVLLISMLNKIRKFV